MKNILVLLHDDAGQEARLQAALDVTRALDGHLTCLDVSILPEYMGDYASIGLQDTLVADEQQAELRNRERLLPRLEREGVSFDWVERTGFLAQAITDQAGLADLIVVNRDGDTSRFPAMTEAVGTLVVEAGRPLLAVCENTRRFVARGRALVAWDGSRDAEAALRAAIPLLQLADCVTLLQIEDDSVRLPVEQAAQYLSRHGIEPIVRKEMMRDDSVGSMLLNETRLGRHDYVVMGGFGRARWIEALLGGATRCMLRQCPVPLFLAHRP